MSELTDPGLHIIIVPDSMYTYDTFLEKTTDNVIVIPEIQSIQVITVIPVLPNTPDIPDMPAVP